MANTTVLAGVTRTTRLDMAGTDTLTVQATGAIMVAANAQAVRFNGATNGAQIQNDGNIQDTAAGGRAIRFETSVGATLNATITNSSTGTIIGVDDAIQIQAGSVTGGKVTINNAAGGSITSATNQAIDFAGAQGTFIAEINNSGTIAALVNDAFTSATIPAPAASATSPITARSMAAARPPIPARSTASTSATTPPAQCATSTISAARFRQTGTPSPAD